MARRNKKLHIDEQNKKFLGVLSGFANFLEVDAWILRLIFIAAVIMGAWFLIPLYFGCWFCLDPKSGEFKENVSKSTTFKHFKNVDYKKKVYRNPEDAKFLGICAGLADYFEIDVALVRIVVFVSFFVAGPIPWIAYFAAYFLLDPKPAPRLVYQGSETNQGFTARQAQPESAQASETAVKSHFEDKFRSRMNRESFSRHREFKYVARRFKNLDKRLIRMEAFVTSSKFKLHQEFKNI